MNRRLRFVLSFLIGSTLGYAEAVQNRPVRPPHLLPGVSVSPDSVRWAARQGERRRAREIEFLRAMFGKYEISPSLAGLIYDKAIEHGLHPELVFRLVEVESEFYPRATSPVGARGLTQVMPGTARVQRPGVRIADLYRPALNLDIGLTHLRFLLRYYDGNLRYALLGYNRGHGTVDKILAYGGDPSNGYAQKVMGD